MRSGAAASSPRSNSCKAPEHLLSERGRDCGLRLAAFRKQRRQPAVVGIGKQAKRIEQQLKAAEHRPAGNGREGAQRKAQIARGLALRRIDEPQLGMYGPRRRSLPLGDEHAGEYAGLPQQRSKR